MCLTTNQIFKVTKSSNSQYQSIIPSVLSIKQSFKFVLKTNPIVSSLSGSSQTKISIISILRIFYSQLELIRYVVIFIASTNQNYNYLNYPKRRQLVKY